MEFKEQENPKVEMNNLDTRKPNKK